MKRGQCRGLLCQVTDQLEVKVAIEKDEAADFKFPAGKKIFGQVFSFVRMKGIITDL
jgi:hypothetical protein